jgi:hypothetical protein
MLDNELALLFVNALQCYRSGRGKSSRPSAAATGAAFDQLLMAAVSTRIPLAEQLHSRVASAARSRALKAARNGQLVVAQQALDEGAAILTHEMLSTECRMLIETFHEAVAAYLDYRRDEHDAARRRVYRAMSIDNDLIKQYGYEIMELHRIQLGHNLVRIEARVGDRVKAAQLCAGLLTYLEGSGEDWPFPELGYGAHPTRLPIDLRRAMFLQVTGELALMLAGSIAEQASRAILIVRPHVELAATADCGQFRVAHAWMGAKWSFINQETVEFLERVALFLEDSLADAPLLWRAAVADLFLTCERFGMDEATFLRQIIADDARSWAQLPQQLRAVFGPALQAGPLSR